MGQDTCSHQELLRLCASSKNTKHDELEMLYTHLPMNNAIGYNLNTIINVALRRCPGHHSSRTKKLTRFLIPNRHYVAPQVISQTNAQIQITPVSSFEDAFYRAVEASTRTAEGLYHCLYTQASATLL